MASSKRKTKTKATLHPIGKATLHPMRGGKVRPLEADGAGQACGLKHDSGKLRYDLEPQLARQLNIAVMSYGAVLYGDTNWRHVENGAERYYAALARHLADYRMAKQVGAGPGGDLVDHESRLATLAHALACLNFLVELECKVLSREQITALFDRALEIKAQKEAKR